MAGPYRRSRADLASVVVARVVIALIALTMIAAVGLLLYKQRIAAPSEKARGGEAP